MNTKTSKSRALVYGVLTILAVGMVIPFVWMLLASFKTSNEVFSIPMKLMPEIWHGENYQEIWKKIPLLGKYNQADFDHNCDSGAYKLLCSVWVCQGKI